MLYQIVNKSTDVVRVINFKVNVNTYFSDDSSKSLINMIEFLTSMIKKDKENYDSFKSAFADFTKKNLCILV